MTVEEFRESISLNKKISIGDRIFDIIEIIKFKFDDGSFYIKCFLSDGYVFADDSNENTFLLVEEIKTNIKEPFGKELFFNNKKFKFLYSAHAVAEKTQGKEIFKKGEGESFWDFISEDRSYLSLGKLDKNNERLDFYGKVIENYLVNLV